MHARLGGDQTVGVFSFYAECDSFQTGFLTGLIIYYLGSKTPSLGPLQVHPQEHLRPILRFGSTRAWMNSADGIALVVLAGQQHLSLSLIQVVLETLDKRTQFFQRLLICFGKLEKHTGVVQLRLEVLLAFDLSFQPAAFLQ